MKLFEPWFDLWHWCVKDGAHTMGLDASTSPGWLVDLKKNWSQGLAARTVNTKGQRKGQVPATSATIRILGSSHRDQIPLPVNGLFGETGSSHKGSTCFRNQSAKKTTTVELFLRLNTTTSPLVCAAGTISHDQYPLVHGPFFSGGFCEVRIALTSCVSTFSLF